jgi:hypothetical protein
MRLTEFPPQDAFRIAARMRHRILLQHNPALVPVFVSSCVTSLADDQISSFLRGDWVVGMNKLLRGVPYSKE